MKIPISINKSGIIPFLSGSVFFYLASEYLGPSYVRIFYFWLFFYLFDLLLIIYQSSILRYGLDFSTDHICKGDSVEYTIHIDNPGLFSIHRLYLEESRPHKDDLNYLSTELCIRGVRSWSTSKTVHARIRGIYTLGLTRLCLSSISGLITIDLPIWYRTFYVYPRLFEIDKNPGRLSSALSGKSLNLSGSGPDFDSFLGLKEYRPGDDLKKISWSRFYQTGTPYIKSFSSRSGSDIQVFLDRRSSGRDPICDDTALEIFLSFVNSCKRMGQRLTIYGYPGWEGKCISNEKDFQALYKSSLTVNFNSQSLEDLHQIKKQGGLYIISSLCDLELLDKHFISFVDQLIYISINMSDNEKHTVKQRVLAINEEDRISEIQSSESLEEELLCKLYF